jgi:hypothetical protein
MFSDRLRFIFPFLLSSYKAGSWVAQLTQSLRIRLAWLGLIIALALTPVLHAQIIGIQDLFNYQTSNINGHAPTTGTGTWTANYYGTANNISTSGSQAVISTNGGTPGAGSAVASLAFTASANTLYTLTATLNFIGPTGTFYDCWGAVGFSNVPGGGNRGSNMAPWMLIRPQAMSTDNPGSAAFAGPHWIGAWNVIAANYSAPIAATITWNTSTGVAQYFINNTLQWTGTTTGTSGSYYAFFQGFQTGNAVNVKNMTVSAQSISFSTIAMQDNFTYVSPSIGGHAPTTVAGSGWGGNWATNLSNGSISASGTQAVIITGSGVSGSSGNAIASYAFNASPNTFYTLRTVLNFTGPIGAGHDCWGGFGFSNSTGGGNNSQNTGPWMLIRPQGVLTDNPQTAGFIGNQSLASGSAAAANYSAPIAATITWNSSTGEARYYMNDLLQWTGTTTLPNGQLYVYFQGFQTGTAVNVNTIVLTAQSSPLPEVWFAPNDFPANFSAIIETGTTPCAWPTAKTHTQVFSCYNTFFWQTGTPAQWTTLINYLKQNNIKLAVCCNPLLKGTTSCNQGEGYDNPYSHTWAIQNIVAAGGNIDYLSLDSPLGDGSVYPSGTCALSIAVAAQQTANTIAIYKAAFPNLKVIDFDSFAYIPTADNVAWFAALQALGQPLDGIMDDVNWYLDYPGQLPGVAATCAAAGVSYGTFYDGFSGVLAGDNNPAQYALGMLINMQSYNASGSPAPTKVCVASWTSPTTITCPETSVTTLAALLNLSMTSPYVQQAPPMGLYTVWNNSNSNLFTSSYTQYLSWIAQGYTDSGVLGGIAQNPNIGGIQGLVPIYLYYRSAAKSYALSLSASDSNLTTKGFTKQSTLGYVFPPGTGLAAGGVAVYEFYKSTNKQFQYSTSSTLPSGFVSDGITFYVLPGWYHYSYLH